MSSGNFGSGIVLPLTVDDTAVDSAFAKLLQKYATLRAELSKPVSLNLDTSGGAVLGQSPSARASSGATAPSEWRMFDYTERDYSGDTGGSRVGSRIPWLKDSDLVKPPRREWTTNKDVDDDSREGFPISARFAAFFAAGGIAAAVGAAQDLSANNFLMGHIGESGRLQRIMSQSSSNIMGFGGALRSGLAGLGLSEFDEQAKYEAAFSGNLSLQKESLDRSSNYQITKDRISLQKESGQIANINDQNKSRTARRTAISDYESSWNNIAAEGANINADLAAETDPNKIQELNAKANVYAKNLNTRLSQLTLKTSETLKALERGDVIDATTMFESNRASYYAMHGFSLESANAETNASFKAHMQGDGLFFGNVGPGDPLYTETKRGYDLALQGNSIAQAQSISETQGNTLALRLATSGHPLASSLAQIEAERKTYRLSHDADSPEGIEKEKEFDARRDYARQRDANNYQLNNLALDGRARELRDDIAHPRNPIFGAVDALLTSGESEMVIAARDKDHPDLLVKARQNLQSGITKLSKNWSSQLRGEQLSLYQFGSLLNENYTEDPAEIMGKFKNAQKEAATYDASPTKLDEDTLAKLQKVIEAAVQSQIQN